MKGKILTGICAVLMLFSTMPSRAQTENVSSSAGSASVSNPPIKLVDGLYIVDRKSPEKASLGQLIEKQILLPDDGRFLTPEERDPVQYVVIDTTQFVPFAFDEKPLEGHEPGTGKPLLQLQFAPKQAADLEALTSKNVGRTVAIVVDNQIVTCHKIREAIKGGKLQITRCTKTGCALIYSRLIKEKR